LLSPMARLGCYALLFLSACSFLPATAPPRVEEFFTPSSFELEKTIYQPVASSLFCVRLTLSPQHPLLEHTFFFRPRYHECWRAASVPVLRRTYRGWMRLHLHGFPFVREDFFVSWLSLCNPFCFCGLLVPAFDHSFTFALRPTREPFGCQCAPTTPSVFRSGCRGRRRGTRWFKQGPTC